MENETKMYILIRSDIEMKTSDLIPAMHKSMLEWFDICNKIEPKRLNYYLNIQPSYPKICKRFKQKHANKLKNDLQNQKNIPYSEIKIEDNIVGYFVGPCLREELNKNVEKLQLLNDCLVEINDGDCGNIAIGYRNDIDIPAGKLIPQFCHAIQKFICEDEDNNYTLFPKGMPLSEIKNSGNYIIDAARTFFNEPTITTCYIKE